MDITHIQETAIGDPIDIFPNVTLLRIPKYKHRFGQGYVLHHDQDDAVLLIDMTREETREIVKGMVDLGKKIDAILLTHGDLVDQAFGSLELVSREAGGAPIFIDPKDTRGQLDFTQDINLDLEVFDKYELTTMPFPGHTPGSQLIFSKWNHGMLFCGDSAVGAPYDSEETYFERPPIFNTYVDQDLAELWENYDLPFLHLLPLHGKPAFHLTHAEQERHLTNLQRKEATVWPRG